MPDFPDGKSSDCLEGERLTLMEEMKKKKKDKNYRFSDGEHLSLVKEGDVYGGIT